MFALEDVHCCKCQNVLPDRVLFPCGHFLCQACEDTTHCLICGQAVCFMKDSLSLMTFRVMVADKLPKSPSIGIPLKNELPVKEESPAFRKTHSPLRKRKKLLKNSSPTRKSTRTPRAIHCPSVGKKLADQGNSRARSRGSTNRVKESNQSGATKVKETPKAQTIKKTPMVKTQLLNCLSTLKPRLKTAEKVKPTIKGIVRADLSPPLKKRKTSSRRRLSLNTIKRHIDSSSDEDDGVFIDSNSILCFRKTVETVAQVHADPCFSSATSVENSQTAGETSNYTQVGLGHLDQDEELDNPVSSQFKTPVKSILMQENIATLSSPFPGFEDVGYMHEGGANTVETSMIDNPADESIIKSSVTPVNNASSKPDNPNRINQDFYTNNLIQGRHTLDVIRSKTILQDVPSTSQQSTMSVIETDTILDPGAAHKPQIDENRISDSVFYSKNTEPMEVVNLDSSCESEDNLHQRVGSELTGGSNKDLPSNSEDDEMCDDFVVITPVHSHSLFEDSSTLVEKRPPKYLGMPFPSMNVSSFESHHPQPQVGLLRGIVAQENMMEPYIHLNDNATGSTVAEPNHPYLISDENPEPYHSSFEDKRSSLCAGVDGNILITTEGPRTQSFGPKSDVSPSEGSLLHPVTPSRDTPPDFTREIPQPPNYVFSNKLPDCLSFAGKISYDLRDQDNIAVTNVSSSESIYQPKACAINIMAPSSTNGNIQSEVPPNCSSFVDKRLSMYAFMDTHPQPELRLAREIEVQENTIVPDIHDSIVPTDFTLEIPKPSHEVLPNKLPDCLSFADKISQPPKEPSEPPSVGCSHEIPANFPSQISAMDISRAGWQLAQKILSKAACKLYESQRPKSLFCQAFDVLFLPRKNKAVFQGLSAISPVTASAEKSVQVDLFLDQTTVKVELGKDLVKRNRFTRRQLAFVPENSNSPQTPEVVDEHVEPEESEDIVEGTPTKAHLVRVNLLNDSTACSPLSKTLTHEESPAQPLVENVTTEASAFSIFDPLPRASQNTSPPSTSTEQTENTVSCTDSESIIGDSEQLPQRKKYLLALPLGRSNQSPTEEVKEGINRPIPFRDISNVPVSHLTTTGIYDPVELNAIQKLCGLIKAAYSSELTKYTTHVIVPDGDDVAVTTKFLMALHNGSYILPMRWVFDCIISKSILPEANYYFKHPGINRRAMLPRNVSLFDGYAFFLSPETKREPVNHKALKDLLTFCNCNVGETPEEIFRLSVKYKAVVLRGADYRPPPNSKGRLVQISYQWFYACLTSFEIQPFDDFN